MTKPPNVDKSRKHVENSGPDSGGQKVPVELVPQAHGGALYRGGNPGNVGGTGRPPSALRALLRKSFEERIIILEQIVDNPDTSANDRIKAIDTLARYGLGPTKEVTGDPDSPQILRVILQRE